jgi:hypothetical protein
LARAVQQVLRSRAGNGPAVTAGVDLFFRFEASAALLDGIARGLFEVMPSADGGFRSAIWQVAGKEIVGHGQYVRTAAGGAGPPALAAKGPKLASTLGFAVVTAALEIAADADQRRRLDAIRKMAAAPQEGQVRERIATLEGAARRLDLAARSALDTGYVPPALGIDSAAGSVSTAWERSARKLEEWRQGLAELPERVDLGRLSRVGPPRCREEAAGWLRCVRAVDLAGRPCLRTGAWAADVRRRGHRDLRRAGAGARRRPGNPSRPSRLLRAGFYEAAAAPYEAADNRSLGSSVARHVGNARRRGYKGRTTIGEESPDSPRKIDAAVCIIGARMVRRLVHASKEWQRRQRRSFGRGSVIELDSGRMCSFRG